MFAMPTPALAGAAETRRRELPASVALLVLTGGLGAAMLGHPGPVGWAGFMALCLIVDAEIYRRLDIAEIRPEGRLLAALTGWAFFYACCFAALPAALWLSGGSAASAAAMVLWIAGVVRQLGVAAGAPVIALAGAAPPALCLLLSPLAMAVMTTQPDWDLAVIAAVGGGALMSYVAAARWAAEDAEAALRARARDDESAEALTRLVMEQAPVAACLLDRGFQVAAMSRHMRRAWGLEGEDAVVGRDFAELAPWHPPHWRDAHAKALAGEIVARAEDAIATPRGVVRLDWEMRPWRDGEGAVCGALVTWRDVTESAEARRAAEADAARLRAGLKQRAEVLVVDGAEQVRDQARESLERLGFAVVCAPGAAEALDLLKLVKPALIILDVDLPYAAGWGLLETLKDIPGTRDIPVLAHSGSEDRAKALSMGACEHLIKPADREVIAAMAARFARAAHGAEPAKPSAPARSLANPA